MRRFFLIAAALGFAGPCCAGDDGLKTSLLRVLYVGNKDSERAQSYAKFLDEQFILLEVADRKTFDPESARNADVILLDSPPSDLAQNSTGSNSQPEREMRSPLGEQSAWSKPTVLLGSAGRQLAVPWRVFGASGCTGLEPFACEFRDHPIFRQPLMIDRTKTTRRPWPQGWYETHDDDEVIVLPLISTEEKARQTGWCIYPRDVAETPEIEFFCGGINPRSAAAIALWRQGNLLHFGFDASPDEMNGWGKALLANAVAYIARFTEDRPILETPLPGAGTEILTRSTMVHIIARNSKIEWDYLRTKFDPETLRTAGVGSLPAFAGWYPMIRDVLYLNPEGLMALDSDALSLDIKPGRRTSFARAIAALARPGERADHARRLLVRYAPDGPGQNATARAWALWWKANGDYLFFSDIGGYRWYLDPLAKERKVATDKLRGEKRASK